MSLAARFGRLPTAAKLLLILTAVLLPIGIALMWLGESGVIRESLAWAMLSAPTGLFDGSSPSSILAVDQMAWKVL